MGELFCNRCWQPLQAGQVAFATACGHLFGGDCGCAKQVFQSATARCTICNTVLTQDDVKKVGVMNDPESNHVKLAQAGQLPEVTLSNALASVQFFVQQRDLYADARYQQLEHKLERMQTQCKKKLSEVHTAYKSVKRKYEEVAKQHQALQGDHQELGEKYNQKAAETKKLKEVLPLLQQECDTMRRAAEQLAHRAGVPPASIPALAGPSPHGALMGIGGGGRAGMLGGGPGTLGRRTSLGPGPGSGPTPFADHGQAPHLGGMRAPPPPPRNNPSPLHSPAFTLGLGGGGGLDYHTPAHLAQPHAPNYTGPVAYPGSLPHGSGGACVGMPGRMPGGGGGKDRRRSSVFGAAGGSGGGMVPGLGLPREFGGGGSLS